MIALNNNINIIKKSITLAPVLITTIISCVADCSEPTNIGYEPAVYDFIDKNDAELEKQVNAGITVSLNSYTPYITSYNGAGNMEDDVLNTYHLNINKLRMMSVLEENWDEEGALPFSADLIEKVKMILQHLNQYQPDIFPKNDSRIQLEFYSEDNRFLKIAVSEKKCDVYSTDNFNYRNDFFDSFDFNEFTIYKIVAQFYANDLNGDN